MKKTVLFALAGIMLLAFTMCSNPKTQAFKDLKAIYDKTEKAINDAQTCDDLMDAVGIMFIEGGSLANKEYAEDEKATDAEKEELQKQLERITDAMKAKELEFGCNEKQGDDESVIEEEQEFEEVQEEDAEMEE